MMRLLGTRVVYSYILWPMQVGYAPPLGRLAMYLGTSGFPARLPSQLPTQFPQLLQPPPPPAAVSASTTNVQKAHDAGADALAMRSTGIESGNWVAVSHARRLSVSNFADLKAAVEQGSDATIELAAGTYLVTSTLSISRTVTIAAADGATVVLDGQNARRVMTISSGVVQLVGLHVTKGNSTVSHHFPCP